MPLTLPLYPNSPSLAVLEGEGLAPDSTCKRCRLHEGARNVCLPAEGDPDRKGGVLVVNDAPSREDELRWRPFTGKLGNYLRPLLDKLAPGVPVTFDNAVKCAPGNLPIDKSIEDCRPYLRQTIRTAVPDRILALGSKAILSVTGRSIWPLGVRKGYSWYAADCPDCAPGKPHAAPCPTCAGSGKKFIPVFYLLDPIEALQNRFLRKIFEEDLKWALTVDLKPPKVWGEKVRVVRTVQDAEEAELDLRQSEWFAFDCEWAGHLYNRSWKLLSVACVPAGAEYAWVWDADALARHDLSVKLKRALEDPKVGKAGHYMQIDAQGVKQGVGATIPDEAFFFDTLYVLNLLDPEAEGALEMAAELVGMGGHKEENDGHLKAAIAAFRKWVKEKHDRSQKAVMKRAQVSLFEVTQDANFGAPVDPLKLWPDMTPELIAEMEAAVLAGAAADDLRSWAFGLVPREILTRYNALDTIATAKLVDLERKRLAEAAWEIRATWEENLRPAIPAIAQVEEWGFRADRDNIVVMQEWLKSKLAEVLEKFRPYGWDPDPAKSKLNLESPDQLADFIYETLRDEKGNKLPCERFTKSGKRSTDAEALEDLEDLHPMIKEVREYKRISTQLKKDLASYIRSDGRIHSRFNLNGARTGRLSSNDPNLQNQKRAEDEEGRLVRNCFVASPGWSIVELDEAQVELRIGMGLAKDPRGVGVFVRGEDFHLEAAKLVAPFRWEHKGPGRCDCVAGAACTKPYGTVFAPSDVGDLQRQQNKPTTFAVFYDDEVYGLAFRLGISVKEAEKVLKGLFGAFTRLPRWIDEQVQQGQREGGVWSWWNNRRCRFRPLYDLGSPDKKKFKTARRGCWNGPTQATANEFVLAALVKMVNWIKAEGLQDVVRLCLTIHDALTFEVRDDYVDLVVHMAYRFMTSFRTPSDVPLDVDCKVGKVWGEMKKYKFKKPKDLGHLPYDEPAEYPQARSACGGFPVSPGRSDTPAT